MHLTTALYVIALLAAFFWVGLYLGRGYRPARPSVEMILPRGVHLFRGQGPARRTERVDLAVPILVTGKDQNGAGFEESTHTRTISGYGAAIVLSRALTPGQEVLIHRIDRSREAGVRVLHEISVSEQGRVYGVVFVDPSADLWGACRLLTEAKAGELESPEPKADTVAKDS